MNFSNHIKLFFYHCYAMDSDFSIRAENKSFFVVYYRPAVTGTNSAENLLKLLTNSSLLRVVLSGAHTREYTFKYEISYNPGDSSVTQK